MKKLLLVAVLAGCFAGLRAETVVTVTNMADNLKLDFKIDSYRLCAETVKQTQYPSDIGDPLFWFDCKQTNGWTFAAGGGVMEIPNLVNDGRYLATDTKGGISLINNWTPLNPVFDANDASLGAPVLDFGVKGSRRAMCFNKVGPEGCQTNILDGIGTVIAVWYSAMGNSTYGGLDGKGTGDYGEGGYYGGALLGGGFGSDGNATDDKSEFVLYRGTPNFRQYETTGDVNRPRWYDNPFANSAHTHVSIRLGHIRHDGQHTCPTITGFNGGWEVISIIPRSGLLLNATGLGMNDARISAVSGGFKVAEMLIFGKVLSVFETARVEAYLQRKWFDYDAFGVNGNAFLSRVRAYRYASGRPAGVQVPVEVGEGEKLTIGELRGGRGFGNPAVVKTGAGKLEILDSSRYDGDVRVEEGTLEFTSRQLPQSLPYDVYLHFDASSADSFVTNSAGEFVRFRNLAGKAAVWKLHEICARPSGEAAPKILRDEFGPGKHALDFGDYVKDDHSRALTFATNETEAVSTVAAKPSGIVTVIAVIGAQRGGCGLLKRNSNVGYFARASSVPCRFSVPFASSSGYSVGNGLDDRKYVTAMIDALPIDYATSGYLHPGYQVVAVRSPGNDASIGICALPWGSGGIRLCEFLAWNRPLSDDEMRDASALLMQKWFGKTAPGDGTVKGGINKVVVGGDIKVNVASGVARVGRISGCGGSVEKTGDGILEYQHAEKVSLSIAGGGVRKRRLYDVSGACEPAADPALHLDVTDPGSMRVVETDEGERRVYEWYSKNDRTVLATIPFRINNEGNDTTKYTNDKYAPYLSSEVRLNGHDTMDFGPFTAASGGRAFSLSHSLDSVRSAYIVWAPRDDSRGNFFGCSKGNVDGQANNELYDFIRTDGATNTATLVFDNGTSDHVREGLIYTNGVKVSAGVVPKAGEFMLAEFHPAAAAHISAIGTDRDVARFSGGIRVAEIVVYERELSEREKIATRNYLMGKWFKAEPQALPEAAVDVDFADFTVSGNVPVDASEQVGIDSLVGEGTVEKTGTNGLSVTELSRFTGKVVVEQGELKLTGRSLPEAGALVAQDALIFHADATSGISAVTNDNGKIEVTEWRSKLDNGWSAVPFYDGCRPTLIRADDLNGGYVVDLGKTGDKQAMFFAKDGVTNLLENIGSVFWMIGSHNGGGYLLGGGHHYNNWNGGRFNFMRGSAGGKGDKPEYPILSSNWVCPWNLQSAQWRIDGVSVDPLVDGLSGGWDLISMNIVNTTYPTSNAEGFAFDGRGIGDNPGGYVDYMGCQRLAEVLIYNRKLTDEETRSVEAYLAQKWRYKGTNAETTNSVEVVLGADASLDLGGNRQYLASLSGSGSVKNGLLAAGRLTADAAGDEHPVFAADARFSVERGMRVSVVNAQNVKAGDSVTIVECADVTGTENLSGCVIEDDGSMPHFLKARLSYVDGKLKVVFRAKPTFIIIR